MTRTSKKQLYLYISWCLQRLKILLSSILVSKDCISKPTQDFVPQDCFPSLPMMDTIAVYPMKKYYGTVLWYCGEKQPEWSAAAGAGLASAAKG